MKLASRSNLDEGLRREVDLFALCFSSEDKDEGVGAVLEKRKPISSKYSQVVSTSVLLFQRNKLAVQIQVTYCSQEGGLPRCFVFRSREKSAPPAVGWGLAKFN